MRNEIDEKSDSFPLLTDKWIFLIDLLLSVSVFCDLEDRQRF